MGFIKRGDAEPVTIIEDEALDDTQTKEILEKANESAKDGNKKELPVRIVSEKN